MLIDAAIRVMTREGYLEMSVSDVLIEAGLSTRAFYRHFESKESLLDALRLRETMSIGRSLDRAVAQATDPLSAVEAWLERYLDIYYQPRRAARASLMAAEVDRGSRLSRDMLHEMRRIACKPLIEALRAGHQAGLLYSATPEVDAYSIHDLVTACLAAGKEMTMERQAVHAHVVRFAWPALRMPGVVR